MKKVFASIFIIVVILTVFFMAIYSEPHKESIYDTDIHVTLYNDYFEIESCSIKKEDCRRKEGERYIDKAKNPKAYRIDYKVGLANELTKYIEKGKYIHVWFVDVSSNARSREEVTEIRELLKRKDARIAVSGMAGL